jgi:uncharacterized protein YcsI (UPF0317 family)
MLTMYAVILSILLVMEIIAGILVVVFRNDIQENLDKSMNETVKTLYWREENVGDTDAWDYTQKTLKCCGATVGPADWQNSYYSNTTKNVVPDSCCVLEDVKAKSLEPVNRTACHLAATDLNDAFIHTKGCSPALTEWIDDHSAILIGVAFGVAVLQMVAIIFACCTKSSLKSQYETI